jgi:hypothetical protein
MKLKNIFSLFIKKTISYKDVNYHTGYYRFNEYFDSNMDNFKIDGIPCIQQYGIKDFIFFTETDITSNNNVIPVKIN